MSKILHDSVLLLPPVRGTCPLCAGNHPKGEPHEVRSLYFQMRYYQKNGRFARKADTCRDCTEEVLDTIAAGMKYPKRRRFWTETETWVRKDARLPSEEDADEYGCVLAWHILNGVLVMNWKNIKTNRFIVCWQRTVSPPEDAEELLKSWEKSMEEKYPSPKGIKK